MTGCSPFEVMRGRLPRTKCSPAWLAPSTSSKLDLEAVKERIAQTHTTNKEYFDRKKGSKQDPIVKVRMLVKVKKPWKVKKKKKGESQFMDPFEIKEVLKNSVRLSNNKVWNLSRIAVLKANKDVYLNSNDCTFNKHSTIEPRSLDCLDDEDLVESPAPIPSVVNVPSNIVCTEELGKRLRKKPGWRSDFVSFIRNKLGK